MPLPTGGCIEVNPLSLRLSLSLARALAALTPASRSSGEETERESQVAEKRDRSESTAEDRWRSTGERDGERETEAHSTLPR